MVFIPRLPTKTSVAAAIAAGGGGGGNPGNPSLPALSGGFGSLGFNGDGGQLERVIIPANGSKEVKLTGPRRGSQIIQSVYQNALFPEPGLVVAGPGQADEYHAGISRAFIPSVSSANFDPTLTDAQKAAVRDKFQTCDVSIRVFPLAPERQQGDGPADVIGFGDLLITVTRTFFNETPAAKFILVDRQPIAASGSEEVAINGMALFSPGAPGANRDYDAFLSIRLDNTTDADISISAGYDNYLYGMRSGITARAVPNN